MKVLAPLPIGFAVFMVHLATIPVTGTGINPARSFGAAVIYNKEKIWDDQVKTFLTVYIIYFKMKHIFTEENKRVLKVMLLWMLIVGVLIMVIFL